MSSFLLSIASGLITALLLVAARQITRVSKTVTDSAAAVSALAAAVDLLLRSDRENRDRIAALWARAYPNPNWRHHEAVSRHGNPPTRPL